MDASTRDSEQLESVLAHALQLRDEGCADWVELACHDFPELAPRVREAARGTDFLPRYFADGSASDAALGRTLGGRFRLSQRIGAGAMGIVYLAEDQELVRNVAVKILRHGLMDPEESMQRFAREAAAMASVQHGAVVTIHDRGRTAEGEHFLVMEWVDGGSLDAIVAEAGQRAETVRADDVEWMRRDFGIDVGADASYVRTVVRWTAELAAGLEVVHAAGVLHRDIKPSNVIVRKDGRPVLLDFGIALLEGDSTLTRGVTSVGTPSYMPPEALVRGRHRTPASDVYSLTATLYHLLALRPPYQGTPPEVLAAIATRDPVPASRCRPGLPRDLQAILEKGMHRKPRARYASASALESDLRAFLEHRPVVARPVTALERVGRALARSKLARGAALALALVLVAAVGFEVRRERAAERRVDAFALERHFPPAFTLVGRTNRVYRYESDRAAVQGLLDQAVANDGADVRAHLLRASFRLDHGDPAGAARDMAVVAGAVDTPYARELAARYAALGPQARGSSAVEMGELPARSSPHDRYLEGYHLLRALREPEAFAVLSDPKVREIHHAEELRITCLPFTDLDTDQEHERALEGYTDAIRLEEELGGRTATTAHLVGCMLDRMSRYDEALRVLRQGVDLAERSHTIRINAGWAAYGLGLHDEARRHFEVAIDLRPNYRKPLANLVLVLIAQEKFDEALARLREAPLDAADDTERWKLVRLSNVETHRALAQQRRGELDASQASVKLALAHLKAAKALGPVQLAETPALLDGLVAKDPEAIFIGLAEWILDDPHNWFQIESLLASLPEDLSVDGTAAMRRVLDALAQRQAGRNAKALAPEPRD